MVPKRSGHCLGTKKPIWHEPSHEPKTVFCSLGSVVLITVEILLSCENTLSENFLV